MPQYTPKELTWWAVGKETTWGTAVTPTYYIPFKDAKPEDVIDTIKDDGIRGALAATYNIMQGVQHSTMDGSGQVFPDSIGLFILAALGSDTVTGTGPYTHTLKLNRTGQPPSLTHSRYDGTNMRQFAGHMIEELSFKWADNAALEYTIKSQGKASAIATTTTPTNTTTIPFMGWQFTATLGGSSNLNLVGFDLSLKRKLYVQHSANNSQQPTSVTSLALEVTGKATFDKADDTELSAFLNNTQPSFVLTGTQPGTSYGLTFQMSKCAFIKDPVTGKEVVQGDVEFEGIDNATDVGPCLIKVINGVATY
jgi:hypothetical protein